MKVGKTLASQIFDFVKRFGLYWGYAQIIFQEGEASQGVSISMLHWLDWARWPSKYLWKSFAELKNLTKSGPTWKSFIAFVPAWDSNTSMRGWSKQRLLERWSEREHLFSLPATETCSAWKNGTQWYFLLSLIKGGATGKALQFIMPMMTIYNKNFCFNEPNCIFWMLQKG